MEELKKKFCPAIWFSGFFGLGAVVHLIRLILRVPMIIGGFNVPLGLSAAVAVVFGALSIGLLCLGLKQPCGKDGKCRF